MMPLHIRPSTPSDAAAIRSLLDRAFAPSEYESRLRELVAGGEAGSFFERVAERGSRLVGCVLYTPATDGESPVGFHLAPVAVDPDEQNQGIGSKLLRETLNAEPIADASVFVLGDPAYYERFGFGPVELARCPFDEDNQHFRALRWQDDSPRQPFEIGYADAFARAAEA